MPDKVLVFYGSYRAARVGIRMANFRHTRGADAELIDAREIGLPILDRMYKEYPKGTAPPKMEELAGKIRAADAFVFVVTVKLLLRGIPLAWDDQRRIFGEL